MDKKNVLKLVAMAGVCAGFVFVPASLAFSDYADDLLVDSYYNDILDVVSEQNEFDETGEDILVSNGSDYNNGEDILEDILASGDDNYDDGDILSDITEDYSSNDSNVVDLMDSSSNEGNASGAPAYDPGSINSDILITKPAAATPIPTPDPRDTRTVKAAMTSDPGKNSIEDNSKAPVDTASSSPAIQAVINQINELRRAEGVAPVNSDTVLNYVAAQRVKETTEKFSHTRPNGRDSITILMDYGVDVGRSGENIACCISTPEGVVSAWKNSAAHRRCMLNPDYKNAGVGTVVSGGCTYWVLLLTN